MYNMYEFFEDQVIGVLIHMMEKEKKYKVNKKSRRKKII